MKFDKETLIVGSTTGIIGSIVFVYFFDPILTAIGRFSSFIMQKMYKGYLDSVYLHVSRGDVNYPLFISFTIVYIGISTLILSSRILVKQLDRAIDKKKNKDAITNNTPSEELITLEDSIQRVKLLKIKVVVVISVCSLFAILMFGDTFVRSNIASKHKQQMIIIAPYITDQKYKELQSMFASMKSQHDYFKLHQELTDIAFSNNIQLPSNILDP